VSVILAVVCAGFGFQVKPPDRLILAPTRVVDVVLEKRIILALMLPTALLHILDQELRN